MNTANFGPSEVQKSLQIYPYYDVVVELALLGDLRATLALACYSHARQIKGDYQDMRVYSGPPGWGLRSGLETASLKNMFC